MEEETVGDIGRRNIWNSRAKGKRQKAKGLGVGSWSYLALFIFSDPLGQSPEL